MQLRAHGAMDESHSRVSTDHRVDIITSVTHRRALGHDDQANAAAFEIQRDGGGGRIDTHPKRRPVSCDKSPRSVDLRPLVSVAEF